MPESTTAIVGGCDRRPLVAAGQASATPETYGHCCRFENPDGLTSASGVIAAIPGVRASLINSLPVSSARPPLTRSRRRTHPRVLPGSAAVAFSTA